MGVRGVSWDEMTRWGKRTKSKGVSLRDDRSILKAHALVSRMYHTFAYLLQGSSIRPHKWLGHIKPVM
jgi:hypothetical protein